METIKLYFKHQFFYLFLLIGSFVVPTVLFLKFSPYPAPAFPYILLGALLASQYGFFKEKDFRNQKRNKITEILTKEYARVPSSKEVNQRLIFVVKARTFSIGFTSLLLIVSLVVF